MRSLSRILVFGAAAALMNSVHAQSPGQIMSSGCSDDVKKFCSNVQPGEGRIVACLKQNKDSLSDQCKQAAAQVSRMVRSGGQSGAQPPVAPPTATIGAPSDTAAVTNDNLLTGSDASGRSAGIGSSSTKHARSGISGASSSEVPPAVGGGAGYLVLRKIQVTGPGPDAAHPTMPAFSLMIPPSWKMKGGIVFGGSPAGCFSDLYVPNFTATSPDGMTVFSAGPDTSWQYADDPAVLKSLNDPNRRALGPNGKPCPVEKPMRAEAYVRQKILSLYPEGTTVVSVAPFPQLDEVVRKRLGLPPGNGNAGATRTDAIRFRLAFRKDGKDQEDWVAVVVITNISSSGRGSFYDSHATSLVEFNAPKGQLDKNDKLFQAIIGSIQPEPQWRTYAAGVITKFSQLQAQKVANINRMWADFYMKAAQETQSETANAMRGSNASVFHEDQIIRGVQTFRDPATGKTQELSNAYDHAWQNGSNDYIQSNDPNFNPNEQLSGNWTQLKPVN